MVIWDSLLVVIKGSNILLTHLLSGITSLHFPLQLYDSEAHYWVVSFLCFFSSYITALHFPLPIPHSLLLIFPPLKLFISLNCKMSSLAAVSERAPCWHVLPTKEIHTSFHQSIPSSPIHSLSFGTAEGGFPPILAEAHAAQRVRISEGKLLEWITPWTSRLNAKGETSARKQSGLIRGR